MAYAGQIIDNPITGERIEFTQCAADTDGELLAFELTLDPDGRFLTQWTGFIYPQGLCLGSDQSLYVGDVSRVVKLDLTGRVTGVVGTKGRGRGQFIGLHGLAVGRDGEIFTAELINWRVQKFVPAPPGRGR